MLAYDLTQVVREVTREHGSGGSILDLVFISRVFTEYSVSVQKGLSDHKLISFCFSIFSQSPNKRRILGLSEFFLDLTINASSII